MPSLGGNPLGGLGNINTEAPRAQIEGVTSALNTLKFALRDASWSTVGTTITSMLKNVGEAAKSAAEDLGGFNSAVSSAGGGGGGGGSGGGPTWLKNATSQASTAVAAAVGSTASAAAACTSIDSGSNRWRHGTGRDGSLEPGHQPGRKPQRQRLDEVDDAVSAALHADDDQPEPRQRSDGFGGTRHAELRHGRRQRRTDEHARQAPRQRPWQPGRHPLAVRSCPWVRSDVRHGWAERPTGEGVPGERPSDAVDEPRRSRGRACRDGRGLRLHCPAGAACRR